MNRYINESDKKMDELLQKYIAGNASEKESQRIMEWLREDEQHLREYKRQRKLYDITLWQTKSPVDIQQEKKDPLRRVLDVIVRIAAVIVFTVATTYFYTHHVLQDKEENMQTVVVPAGQHAELYLADGTHVWLNSGSRLTFPGRFSKKVRHVELDGEGYFKVSSNIKQPFIVGTNRCNIRVLGTEFNVLAYEKDSIWETALLEGAVEILQKKSEVSLMKLKPGDMARLSKNQLTKEKIHTTDYFRWKEGLICFNDISLRDIMEKLKLYYDVNFVINNQQILDAHYTGKFRTHDGIEHVIRVLALNNKFTYIKDNESNTITINKLFNISNAYETIKKHLKKKRGQCCNTIPHFPSVYTN